MERILGTSIVLGWKIILNDEKFLKILSVVPFVFLALSVLSIVGTPPASGYEISFYGAYSQYFWIFFIGMNFSAVLLIALEIFSKKKTNRWVLGFFSILLGNFIFTLLPVFRGYCFYGGAGADIFTHIGWVNDLLQSGHISLNNFYPVIHILMLYISNLLGVSVSTASQFIPSFFWMLYPPFMLLLGKSISKNNDQALIITLFSIPLIFSIFQLTLHPSFLSFIFLPLLMYTYHKRNHSERKLELTIIIMILCFLIVFFHPITTIVTTIIFSIFAILDFLRSRNEDSMASTIVIILFFSWFTWYTSYGWGQDAMYSIYQHLLYGSDFTIISHYSSSLDTASPTILQTIGLVILRYGSIGIYGLIAFLFLMATGIKLVFLKKIKKLELVYCMQLVATLIIAGAMTVVNLIVSNPIRSARFFIMIAAVVNGLFIYSLLEKRKVKAKNESKNTWNFLKKYALFTYVSQKKMKVRKILLPGLVIFILMFSIFVCIFNVYPSPVNWQQNSQFTHMNFAGSIWIVENRNISIQTSGTYGFSLLRVEHYINGIMAGNARYKSDFLDIRTHFGYDENNSLSTVFDYKDTYMITTENARQAVNAYPKNIQSKSTQFTSDDFDKLNSDIAVCKLYENKETEIWFFLEGNVKK